MSVGTINWFGGVNKKTGRTNDFGFITTIEPEYGEELYFNQKNVLTEEQCLLDSGVCNRSFPLQKRQQKLGYGDRCI